MSARARKGGPDGNGRIRGCGARSNRSSSRSPADFRPYAPGDRGVPAMADFGTGYRHHVTGLAHDERGYPTQDAATVSRLQARLHAKLEDNRAEIVAWESVAVDDADVVVVAFGIVARAARRAMAVARAAGIRAGLFRPRTLWPFPDRELADLAREGKNLLVAEMNMGQIVREVERAAAGRATVAGRHRADGQPLTPDDILAGIETLARGGARR